VPDSTIEIIEIVSIEDGSEMLILKRINTGTDTKTLKTAADTKAHPRPRPLRRNQVG